jgi:3-oxoacyl-(acyl-carrier-protein) synthase
VVRSDFTRSFYISFAKITLGHALGNAAAWETDYNLIASKGFREVNTP